MRRTGGDAQAQQTPAGSSSGSWQLSKIASTVYASTVYVGIESLPLILKAIGDGRVKILTEPRFLKTTEPLL